MSNLAILLVLVVGFFVGLVVLLGIVIPFGAADRGSLGRAGLFMILFSLAALVIGGFVGIVIANSPWAVRNWTPTITEWWKDSAAEELKKLRADLQAKSDELEAAKKPPAKPAAPSGTFDPTAKKVKVTTPVAGVEYGLSRGTGPAAQTVRITASAGEITLPDGWLPTETYLFANVGGVTSDPVLVKDLPKP